MKEIDGIGAHTIERIKEVLENGSLSELKEFKEVSQVKEKGLE